MTETTKRKDTFNWQHDKEKKKQFLKDNLLKLTDKEMAIEISKRWPEDGKIGQWGITKKRQRWDLLKPRRHSKKNTHRSCFGGNTKTSFELASKRVTFGRRNIKKTRPFKGNSYQNIR